MEARLAALMLVVAALVCVGALGGSRAASAQTLADEARIAFVSTRDGHQQIYTLKADGSDQRRVTEHTLNDTDPSWSPDGRRIAFTRFQPRQGAFPTQFPTQTDIWITEADATGAWPLTETESTWESHPAWSPDGRIAYVAWELDPENPDSNRHAVVVAESDGSDATTIHTRGFPIRQLAWSRDGSRLAFFSNAKIWMMNANGGELKQFLSGFEGDFWIEKGPSWSPDDDRLAFDAHQGALVPHAIYVTSPGPSAPVQRLTSNNTGEEEPAWSPDGSRLAFTTSRTGQRQIAVMDANGGNQTVITSSGSNFSPDWQPTPGSDLDFDWTMPERYGADGNGDGLIDSFPPDGNGDLEIAPDGWRVDFDADQEGEPCDRTLERTWLLDGVEIAADDPNVVFYDPTSCDFSYRFEDEGTYPISLEVRDEDDNVVGFVTKDVVVQDWLVVSIGDSVASGEGNPDTPVVATWQNRQCHRSALAGPARAALALEEYDRRTSVTFIHLACSGATTLEGLLGPYAGQEPGTPLPPQVEELERLAGGREVDAVLVSIGANDVHFSEIVVMCLEQRNCAGKGKKSAASFFQQYLAGLPSRYNALASDLQGRGIAADRIYLSEYFDPTRDDRGAYCDKTMLADASLTDYFGTVKAKSLGFVITAEEAAWASNTMMPSLNAAGVDAATRHGWNYVGGIRDPFLTHGYCAEEHWVVRYTESIARQGNRDGTLHPNAPGHELYGQRIASELVADLYAGGKPRSPREEATP
jgi:Tol biopolymer transport system component